jgi:hypothetical protein
MCKQSFLRRPARLILAIIFFACSSPAKADHPEAAVLTRVALADASPDAVRIELKTRGAVGRVHSFTLDGGRFVFDLAPVTWDGPTRRVSPHFPGVREYRYSQFSTNPLVTRLVIEVETGWSCRHEISPTGILVTCGGPPGSAPGASTIAVVRRVKLSSPLAGLGAEDLVDRSIGYTPKDIVRDGLPHFGSPRDDWQGAPRPHKGVDIYVDTTAVQAAAKGKVAGVGDGSRAGGWIKLDHGSGVETVYVHVSGIKVSAGENVVKGQRIAAVDGPSGNAIEAQLHFELRLDGESVDFIPFIFELASDDLKRKITRNNQRLEVLARERAEKVRQMPHH